MRESCVIILLIVATFPMRSRAQESATNQTLSLSPREQSALDALPENKGAPNPKMEMVRSESQRVFCKMSATMTTPSMAVDTWVVVVPKLPSFDGQEVLKQETSMDALETVDQSPGQRPLLRSKVAVRSPKRPSTSSYDTRIQLQLFSRTLKPRNRRTKPAKDLSTEQRQLYLLPSRHFDYDSSQFKQWKEQRGFQREPRESEVSFAARVFRAITTEYRYMFEFGQNRTASSLCGTNQTDCGGLSILFTTVMRSESIPARTLVGRFAKSAGPSAMPDRKRDEKYHVIAEFFAQGIGWIPVDGSSAVLHDRTPQKSKYFGNQDGNFITFHFDQEVMIDTDLWGVKPMGFVQVPKYWFRGKGKFNDTIFEHDWMVRKLPPNTSTRDPARMKGSAAVKPGERENSNQPRSYVYLPLTHVRQGERLCAPTSASIVLLGYGFRIPPAQIKQLANSVTHDPSFPGTYFKDLVGGLATLGFDWGRQQFPTDRDGFLSGIAVIEESLREGNPVIVDTAVPPDGHTVVVNGIDPNRKLVLIVDPNIPAPGLRRLSYDEFEKTWRSLTIDTRGCILPKPKGQ